MPKKLENAKKTRMVFRALVSFGFEFKFWPESSSKLVFKDNAAIWNSHPNKHTYTQKSEGGREEFREQIRDSYMWRLFSLTVVLWCSIHKINHLQFEQNNIRFLQSYRNWLVRTNKK